MIFQAYDLILKFGITAIRQTVAAEVIADLTAEAVKRATDIAFARTLANATDSAGTQTAIALTPTGTPPPTEQPTAAATPTSAPVAATPRRALKTETALLGKSLQDALTVTLDDYTPIGDMRASADYRSTVANALLHKALLKAAGMSDTWVLQP